MIQAGAIQVIPGSGGQLGQIIAARALPGPGSQPPSNTSGGAGPSAPSPRPVAVALVPLSANAAALTTLAHAQPAGGTRAGSASNTAGSDSRQIAPSSAPAPSRVPSPTPVNSAASVITIIQQRDPRDLPATPGMQAAPDNTGSPAERQQQDREDTPQQARQPTGNPALLTASEREIVRELRARDAQVRSEEESHQALAGANAGMIRYSYNAGPDGRLYATAGKVSIRPLQGLDGIAAIANQAAISRAASLPGSSAADFNVAKGASMNISTMLASQASAAAESYRITLGLNTAPGTVDLRG